MSNPVAAVLLILGYSLVIPVAVRWSTLQGRPLRVAVAAGRFGLALAAAGWAARGTWVLAAAHLAAAVVLPWWVRLLGGRST